MLLVGHSAILSTFIKLPIVIKIFFCLFLSGHSTQFCCNKYKVSCMRRSRGSGGRRQDPPPPGKSQKNKSFFSITGPDPLKITKLPSQHHHIPFFSRFSSNNIEIASEIAQKVASIFYVVRTLF